MTNLVLKALMFAKDKHHGQMRKVSGEEYITHPLAVSYIVAGFKKSKVIDEILAAALCHDLLEDTNTTFHELVANFTPLVASLVLELTNNPDSLKILGKLEYQKRKLCGISSYGLVIKLADRLHNISDHPTDRMIVDTKELIVHLESHRKLSKTHKNIISEIKKLML